MLCIKKDVNDGGYCPFEDHFPSVLDVNFVKIKNPNFRANFFQTFP